MQVEKTKTQEWYVTNHNFAIITEVWNINKKKKNVTVVSCLLLC